MQINSLLDSQSSRCLHYFPAAMLVFHGGTPTWRLHTGLCKFVQNISRNIWSLRKHVYQSPITSQFLDFIHLMVFDLLLYCVTVQAKNCSIARLVDSCKMSRISGLDSFLGGFGGSGGGGGGGSSGHGSHTKSLLVMTTWRISMPTMTINIFFQLYFEDRSVV